MLQKLTLELDELRRDHPICSVSVTSSQSLTGPVPTKPPNSHTTQPPIMINTLVQAPESTNPKLAITSDEISYTMGALLDKYETLDEESKSELLKYAISSGNETLQSCLMMLRADKTGTSLAKLTKELIKLAESYKVPELKFDEQASKQRHNYQTWLMKLQPILAMFTQTASVLPRDKVVPFTDPTALGNRAFYLLISSQVDSYFQRAIRQFEPFGDKALELLQEQCAHISREDKSYCHEMLIGLQIQDNQSASNFIKRFTYTKTTAEAASNTYTNEQLMDFVLAGLQPSKQEFYRTALQIYRLDRLQGTTFTLREIEQNFFQIDESVRRDKRQTRTEHAMAVGTARGKNHRGSTGRHPRSRGRGVGHGPSLQRLNHATAAAAQGTSQLVCYNCGEPGHIAPRCPHPQHSTGPGTTHGTRSTAHSTVGARTDTGG
jgi:hypothetical protein